jgi:hypothetical protein
MKTAIIAAALALATVAPVSADADTTCGRMIGYGADAGVTVLFYDAERGLECRPVQFAYLHLVDRAQSAEFGPGPDCRWFEDGSIACE